MKRALWLASALLASSADPCAALPAESRSLRIFWIDVEGGAATLVVTPSGESLLLDAGWVGERDAPRIASAAREAGVERIDHLLISHFHGDHFGGVAELARALPIGRSYDRGLPESPAEDVRPEYVKAYLATTGGKQTALKAGEKLQLGDVEVEVLCANGIVAGEPAGAPRTRSCTAEPAHPAQPDDPTDNALCVGVVLRLGDFEFLDLGDLTWNVEHKLHCPENLIGAIDVFQVSHHGLDDANSPAFLAALRPTVAVLNNGPAKGADAATFRWLGETASIEDVFQLHRNVTTGPADNAPPELVANDDESCLGEHVQLTLDPDGKSYTIEVPSKETKRTYAVRKD